MSLGSHGRREPVPSSDVDSGMAWRDAPEHDPLSRAQRAARLDPHRRVHAGHRRDVADCVRVVGWRLDPHGVTASGAFSASSIEDWRASDRAMARPTQRQPGPDRHLDPARRPHRLRPAARPGRQAAAVRDRSTGRPSSAGCSAGAGREAPDGVHARHRRRGFGRARRGPSTSSTAACFRSSTWRATPRCGRTFASPPRSSGSGARRPRGCCGATEARDPRGGLRALQQRSGSSTRSSSSSMADEPDDNIDPKRLDPLTQAIPAGRLQGGRGGTAIPDRPSSRPARP